MSRYVYKRVVMIGVDGAGAFFKDADTPNIDRIFADGAVSYEVLTAKPTISAECWGSMLIGVTAQCHRKTNFNCDFEPYDENSCFPSVFRVIRENMPEAVLASFNNYNGINKGLIENNIGVLKVNASDAELTDKICDYLAENDPTFLFCQFDEVDGAGHRFDYGSPEFMEKMHITDQYIGRIYESCKKRGFLEDTLFIVNADHGGWKKAHGGLHDQEKYVMVAACGKTVEKGVIQEMEIRDCAAIILYALGLEAPDTWTARVPSGLFSGVTAGERPVYEIEYDNPFRNGVWKITPDWKNEYSILDCIGKERVKAYLPLDEDIADVTGNMSTQRSGKLYFVDGYFGNGVQFQDGGVIMEGNAPEDRSFTLSFWMKTGSVSSVRHVFRYATEDGDMGIDLRLCIGEMCCYIRNGMERERYRADFQLPRDYSDGWVYVTFVVDWEKGELRLSYDFGEFMIRKIPEEYQGISLKGSKSMKIGQSDTYQFIGLYAVLDEFLLTEGCIDQEDLERMGKYYGKGDC